MQLLLTPSAGPHESPEDAPAYPWNRAGGSRFREKMRNWGEKSGAGCAGGGGGSGGEGWQVAGREVRGGAEGAGRRLDQAVARLGEGPDEGVAGLPEGRVGVAPDDRGD